MGFDGEPLSGDEAEGSDSADFEFDFEFDVFRELGEGDGVEDAGVECFELSHRELDDRTRLRDAWKA